MKLFDKNGLTGAGLVALIAAAAAIGAVVSAFRDTPASGAPVTLDETPGGRTGHFLFDTRYLADAGSYLTNGTAHVALVKTVNIIPDTTEVLVYAREIAQTNAEDWIELTPRLTIADFPHDYALENATNHDVMVTADYVPPTPVITNYLFRTAAKISLGWTGTDALPIVVPHSILETEDNE